MQIAKYLLIILLLLTVSCSSKYSGLETRDDIEVSVSKMGQNLFTYNMYWYIPLSSQHYQKERGFLAAIGIGSVQRISVNNENKLQLEELAVRKLDSKLNNHKQCAKGHKIENTFWYERSIRFSGTCW